MILQRNTKRELMVKNSAPDTDVIGIAVSDYRIFVEREENGAVTVTVIDDEEGSETTFILGEEGYSQRV